MACERGRETLNTYTPFFSALEVKELEYILKKTPMNRENHNII